MADPERWFPRWLRGHLARHPRADWPAPDGPDGWPFYRGWLASFRERAVAEAEAEAASLKLLESPPRYLVDHLPALLARAAIARERAAPPVARLPRSPSDGPADEWARRWDRLEGPERAEVLAAVRAAHPALARWESLLRPLCAEELKARSALQPNPS